MKVGDLVIVTAQPELGVGRIERILDDGNVRVLLYKDGSFIVRQSSELAPCPPNTRVA